MRFIVPATATVYFVSCNIDKKERQSSTDAGIKDFTRGYDQIWASRDTGLIKRAMNNQYINFTSTGSTRKRSVITGWFIPADKYKVEKAERTEISILLQRNIAIVSSRWVGNGIFGNEKFNDDQRRNLMIQKSEEKLKLLAEHCTQITGGNE